MTALSLPSQGDAVTRLVAWVLLAMSVMAWVVILYKSVLLHVAKRDLSACKNSLMLANDWHELAVKAGIDPEGLKAQMAGQHKVKEGPFYALGPVKAYVVFTDGGLRVNPSHQVLGADQAPIRGLYAAGSAGQGGLLLEGHGHHLAWAFVSGRRAARFVAAENHG